MPGTTPLLGIPYPQSSDAPDGAGSLYALAAWLDTRVAPMDRICDAYWGDSTTDPQQIGATTWSNLATSTTYADPYNMRQDSITYKLPWDGRYGMWLRTQFTADDTAGRYLLEAYSLTANADLAMAAIPVVRANTPVAMNAEFLAAANTTIRPRVYRDTTAAQYQKRFVSQADCTRLVLRWLGPA